LSSKSKNGRTYYNAHYPSRKSWWSLRSLPYCQVP